MTQYKISQSLGVETVDPLVMQRPPRNRQDDIITRPLIMRVLTSGLLILAGGSSAVCLSVCLRICLSVVSSLVAAP